jgi:aldehyde dehydrogenase (NAD+)
MDVLKALNLGQENAATCSAKGWTDTHAAKLIDSINPATEERIAKIFTCERDDYETVIQESITAQKEWARLPAPKRGELIRRIGDELRKHKDALGSLVAMEMGKIKQEGDGEVQEMIDIADFAVGQSRMLYGRTMHSERPERLHCRYCRQYGGMETFLQDPAVRHCHPAHLQPGDGGDGPSRYLFHVRA